MTKSMSKTHLKNQICCCFSFLIIFSVSLSLLAGDNKEIDIDLSRYDLAKELVSFFDTGYVLKTKLYLEQNQNLNQWEIIFRRNNHNKTSIDEQPSLKTSVVATVLSTNSIPKDQSPVIDYDEVQKDWVKALVTSFNTAQQKRLISIVKKNCNETMTQDDLILFNEYENKFNEFLDINVCHSILMQNKYLSFLPNLKERQEIAQSLVERFFSSKTFVSKTKQNGNNEFFLELFGLNQEKIPLSIKLFVPQPLWNKNKIAMLNQKKFFEKMAIYFSEQRVLQLRALQKLLAKMNSFDRIYAGASARSFFEIFDELILDFIRNRVMPQLNELGSGYISWQTAISIYLNSPL